VELVLHSRVKKSDYIAAALNEYKNNIERGPQSALMYAQAAALSESDIKELSKYIVTL
jgi:cytochrome c553